MNCPRLAAPVVLAHGLFGFERLGLGRLTLATYFRSIPQFLRAAGNRVLVTRVHPTAGIRRRAQVLGRRILAAFPDEPVHIIAHSMGGLDARQLLTDPFWTGRVLSLTTIGTPHLGSALADAAHRRLSPVYRLLESTGLDHNGFFDITRRAARAWHRATPMPRYVPCFSVTGEPRASDVCWPLRGLHAALFEREGPNDGIVAVASAEAFGTPLARTRADHLRQLNWLTASSKGALCPVVRTLYAEIIENLAELGFGERDQAVARRAHDMLAVAAFTYSATT